ncbi:transposase [Collinsella ihumii]|uniref:transposase n=1 Tax=Collinsella ihumii TaxID=1720204 RepID=UPI0008351BEE|nr:transposase [Collinsella ihumii]
MLLPPDVSDLIPENAMARLVDAIVERMDRRLLESLYPGGGAPAHDPSMMLKVVLFCYVQLKAAQCSAKNRKSTDAVFSVSASRHTST